MASSTDTRTVPPLIPAPAELAFGEGAFTLYARSPISFAGKVTLATVRELQSAIQGATGLKLPLGRSTDAGVITVTAEPDDLGPEEYVLAVTPEQVSLRA